jgi:hypothetical protein
MSAVRMVAFGVLELKHKEGPLWVETPEAETKQREEDRQRDELRKLVNDELKKYGLLLTRSIYPKGNTWRTKNNQFILYGQKAGAVGFMVRETIYEGSFKDCCARAVEILDKMDEDNEIK